MDREWADDVIIAATCDLYDVSIVIYEEDGALGGAGQEDVP